MNVRFLLPSETSHFVKSGNKGEWSIHLEQIHRLASAASAPLKAFDLWGASPHEVYVTNL